MKKDQLGLVIASVALVLAAVSLIMQLQLRAQQSFAKGCTLSEDGNLYCGGIGGHSSTGVGWGAGAQSTR